MATKSGDSSNESDHTLQPESESSETSGDLPVDAESERCIQEDPEYREIASYSKDEHEAEIDALNPYWKEKYGKLHKFYRDKGKEYRKATDAEKMTPIAVALKRLGPTLDPHSTIDQEVFRKMAYTFPKTDEVKVSRLENRELIKRHDETCPRAGREEISSEEEGEDPKTIINDESESETLGEMVEKEIVDELPKASTSVKVKSKTTKAVSEIFEELAEIANEESHLQIRKAHLYTQLRRHDFIVSSTKPAPIPIIMPLPKESKMGPILKPPIVADTNAPCPEPMPSYLQELNDEIGDENLKIVVAMGYYKRARHLNKNITKGEIAQKFGIPEEMFRQELKIQKIEEIDANEETK